MRALHCTHSEVRPVAGSPGWKCDECNARGNSRAEMDEYRSGEPAAPSLATSPARCEDCGVPLPDDDRLAPVCDWCLSISEGVEFYADDPYPSTALGRP